FVFQKFFLIWTDQPKSLEVGGSARFLATFRQRGGIQGHEAEEDFLAPLTQRYTLHAVLPCLILLFGEGYWVDDPQAQLTAAGDHHFPQQFLHAGAVGAQLWYVCR